MIPLSGSSFRLSGERFSTARLTVDCIPPLEDGVWGKEEEKEVTEL